MKELNNRINAFIELGKQLHKLNNTSNQASRYKTEKDSLKNAVIIAGQKNPWFTLTNINFAIKSISYMLNEDSIRKLVNQHSSILKENLNSPKTIAVIMPGNIPLAGFQDFFHVLLSGNKILAKLSADDDVLLPAISQLLIAIEPEFSSTIIFEKNKIENFDAVIVTGSNNTSRYFEYYFRKYPNIIRKNRNSIAILDGDEDEKTLLKLTDDVFLYFGMGCRSVSKLYVPKNYDFKNLLDAFKSYSHLSEHHKYMNNYKYYKSIFLIDNHNFIDGGFFLLINSADINNPVSILNYECYDDKKEIIESLKLNAAQIQCIVGNSIDELELVPFGKSQMPEIYDFADNINTLEFLYSITKI